MRGLEEINIPEKLNSMELGFIYIYSPFCATCHLAHTMLETIEHTMEGQMFWELNASLHPKFMQNYQIKSVPCLLITNNGEIKEKIYAFHSVPYMYDKVRTHVKK
ncbi:thioredoxin family protein [Halobacillus campisalis]|uniref:Thioredoxin family protein n=1 Tax=Halobacillus campisalis TaxID=435909 RepID=A0ABW2K8R6_9BACI|nr:thioredoxin family protein [Halobacillus campisalis]